MARLPTTGEPLVLSNGVTVEASAPVRTQVPIAVPTHSEAQHLVSKTRRKLAEMPALPKEMNAVAVLLVYTASGLSDDEISLATNLSREQITSVRDMAAYTALEGYLIGAVKDQTKADVKSILSNAAIKAAKKVEEKLESKDEAVSLRAARDILDREGFAAAQQIDIRQQMMSTLRIDVVDKRNQKLPTMEIEHE